MSKSRTVWIWQPDKRTDDYKIILNCVRKLTKHKSEKEAGKGLLKSVIMSVGAGRTIASEPYV